ncbi:MAG: UDP-3-O-acylglucosamine N-acyltransferase [Candidatus Ordinivivax streblomastigis]|uniref:UDP-3-O-acylglucosamine N-acyltransferase n=1 Tax=Candidatus Ordinivivax streblomastigis TaxID=2540710 RepID=A0A5M8NZ70_9BACT|nr:MAG: UDP-3-O-acylglucosamine N-acyltransferase [Candidatus Ordinivivax streblomastigis]
MEFSAQQIADIIHGTIEGNPDIQVRNFSKIEAGKPHTLTFLANPKYTPFIYETQASIALVNDDFVPEKALPITLTLIRVPNAYSSLAQLLSLVSQAQTKKQGIETPSFISPSAVIPEKNVYIGAFAYIGENVRLGENTAIYPHAYIGDNVVIEENTILYAGVKIYANCQVGKNCMIHAGAVIGADGFGFAKEGDIYNKIPQLGNVVIEDDVEIGANTTIDRAVMGSTVIGKGVKLDNLIQIAHNVEIGENTVIAAQTGVAGSTKIGKACIIAGQVGIGGHITIGDKVSFGAQSGTLSNIAPGRTIMGYPAIDVNKFLRSAIIYAKLPELATKIDKLQNEIEVLKQQ